MEEYVFQFRRRSKINQYITAFVVNIFSILYGSLLGWTSPIVPHLQSDDPPNGMSPISEDDASWFGSIPSLTCILTAPVFTYTIDKFGRKVTGYLMAVPFVISWLLVIFANSAVMIYIARFVGGLGCGGIGIFAPTYIGDISEDDIKGRLGTFTMLMADAGILLAYIIGSYVSYQGTGYIFLSVPFIFVFLLYWIPESPIFLIMKNKETEAKNSLAWFRNGDFDEDEMLKIKSRADEVIESKKMKIPWRHLKKKGNQRCLIFGLVLMANNQLAGALAIISYTVTIFKESGSDLDPNVSTIIIGVMLTVGAFLSTIIIEYSGRRILMATTNFCTFVCLLLLGVYFYLKNIGRDVSGFGWLPVTCLSVFIITYACGPGTNHATLMMELTSPQVSSVVFPVCMFFVSAVAFMVTKCFLPLSTAVGMHGSFWIFSGFSLFFALFVLVAIPETKNRSVEDINEQLNRDDYFKTIWSNFRKTNTEEHERAYVDDKENDVK